MSLSRPSPLEPFLERLASRTRLGPEEFRAILNLPAQPVQIRANRNFVQPGERVSHACFIVAGLVGHFGQNRRGARQITAVHLPGDMVGLQSVVLPEASYALQALSLATILYVPHEALRGAVLTYPAIAEAFWRESAIDAAVLAEWVVNVGRRNARSRVAHLLCEIACRVGGLGEKDGVSIPFAATQTHIADMTGLTPVHVNRVLRALTIDRIVAVQSRMIHVVNWQALTEVGEFDANYLSIPKPGRDRIFGSSPGRISGVTTSSSSVGRAPAEDANLTLRG